MPNYRRLISYIYAYEGAVKGKNIGFAKIETRGVQCKITVSVKRIYVGGNDIGVYLLAADQEIFLGNIFIRGGSGEFRTVVSAGDIEHSGINVDQCYGLTIHDVKNTWRSYTTIWEDAVAHAAEVDLESAAKVVSEKEQTVISEEQIKRAVREIEEEFPLEPDKLRETSKAEISQEEDRVEASSNDRTVEEDVPAAEEQELPEEEDLQVENLETEDQVPADGDMDFAEYDGEELVNAESEDREQEWITSDEERSDEDSLRYTEEPVEDGLQYTEEPDEDGLQYTEKPDEDGVYTEEPAEDLQYMEEPGAEQLRAGEYGEPIQPWEPEIQHSTMQSAVEQVSGYWQNDGQEDIPSEMQEMEVEQEAGEAVDVQEREAVFSEPYPFSAQDGIGETICYRADAVIKESMDNQEVRPELGNPDELERLRQNEIQEDNTHHMIWEKLKREHTRILAFDYEDGCEILTIKPQDIGILPRDAWVYGNNSFLLHGYYNYRYLILAKLLNPSGQPRYLLGIPGHYYSNERYMASMFGFPNFVLSKEQPMEDGRFGFWYTDVKLGG
nr:DUF6128 domain-containing protein [Lacrimispora sp.]